MIKKGLSSDIRFQDNNKKAVLLIHGFRGAPTIFKELSNILYKNGFSYYNLRLPGHCHENPYEILKTRLRDWETVVENTYLDLKDNFNSVYLCGVSLGGALALNLAAKYTDIKKIVVYSPLLKFHNKLIPFSGILGVFKKSFKANPPDCSINNPALNDYYPFMTVPQLFELYKLTLKLSKNLKKIKSRVLCFIAKQDHIFNFDKLRKFIEKKTFFNKIVLKNSFHNLIIDKEKDFVIKKTIDFLKLN